MYYVGLDVHKKTISYCVKDVSGDVQSEGSLPATRSDLDRWMKTPSAAVDSGDGSHRFHRLDLRSSEAACGGTEGGASADAAVHRRSPSWAETANGSLVLFPNRNHGREASTRADRKDFVPTLLRSASGELLPS